MSYSDASHGVADCLLASGGNIWDCHGRPRWWLLSDKGTGRITAAHAMSRVLMNQNLSTFSVINSFDDEVAGGEPTAVVVGTLTGGDTIGQVAVVMDSDFI